MFRASAIPISNDLVKEANSIFYNFIWNGKDKVKRCALISDIDKGGLKMLDIESMVSARCVRAYSGTLSRLKSPKVALSCLKSFILEKAQNTQIALKRVYITISKTICLPKKCSLGHYFL